MPELKIQQDNQSLGKFANADLVVTPEGVVVSIQNRSKRGRKSRHKETQPLRAIRLSRGHTLEELSEITKMSPSYLSRLESGTRRLNADTIKKLANALQCNPNDLLSTQDKWNPGIQSFFLNPNNFNVAEGKINKNPSNPFANDRIALYSSDTQDGSIDLNNCSQSIPCPPELGGVHGAFAYTVCNDSMSPKYRKGDIVYIHPGKPLVPGSYALVISSNAQSLIGEFIGWSDDNNTKFNAANDGGLPESYCLELKQYSTSNNIKLNQNEISSVGRIIGSLDRI